MKRAQEFRLHPCLVHMRGYDEGSRSIDYTLMENGDLWAFFQGFFAGTNLYQFIGNDVVYWSIDLLEALKYMHEDLNLLHMDIKADNIFLDRHFNAVLADFGLARPMPIRNNHSCQVPYAPPEARANCPEMPPPYALPQKQNHGIASEQAENYDTFSLGVVLYMILAWPGSMHAAIEKVDRIVYQDEDWTPRIPITPQFKSVINLMMCYEKLGRPTAAHLLSSPFYLEFKALAKNPRWGSYTKQYTDEIRRQRQQLNIKESKIAELDILCNARARDSERARNLEKDLKELRAKTAGQQPPQPDVQNELRILKGKYSQLQTEATERISHLENEVEETKGRFVTFDEDFKQREKEQKTCYERRETAAYNRHQGELLLARHATETAEEERNTAVHEKKCLQTLLDDTKRELTLITADRDELGKEVRKLEAALKPAEKVVAATKDSGQGQSFGPQHVHPEAYSSPADIPQASQSATSTSAPDTPIQVTACTVQAILVF